MLKLFEPTSKVQKNRTIMRETDMRMAKYGRRGLISNFLIFSLCLFTSDTFVQKQPKLALMLSVGLLLTTLVRGYFLFRLDAIYPRAPAAWRNRYFWSTLAGSCWWCIIMVCLTLVLGMKEEAPLMWLYTVVFFSTTAHAFAPYKRFLSLYQFIGIVPAAASTVLVGEFIGLFYACILLMFYWILHHHSELMADTYWGHLEANYSLKRKAETLEEEKRDTWASAQLSFEYLNVLAAQLGSPEQKEEPDSELTGLRSNLGEFHKILSKDLKLERRIFNVRHFVQFLVRQKQAEAEHKGIMLETAIAPAMPSRLVGDPVKIGQIVNHMLEATIAQCDSTQLFLEMEFAREYEAAGMLLITLSSQTGSKKKFFNDESTLTIEPDLELVLAKGLAEAMGGALEFGENLVTSGKCMSLRVRMDVAEINPRLDYHRVEYKARPLLLVNNNARWLDHKRLELDTLGFNVETLTDYKKAGVKLLNAITRGRAAQSVVYSVMPGDDAAVDFANELLSHNDLKYTTQFVVCSRLGQKYFSDRLIQASSNIHFVKKPSGIFEFELAANKVFVEADNPDKDQEPAKDVLWVALDKKSKGREHYQSEQMNIIRAEDLRSIARTIQDNAVELAVIEYCADTAVEAVQAIRDSEHECNSENLMPIIGVGPLDAQEELLLAGIDQFVTLESIVTGDDDDLCYWLGGRHL